MMRRLDDLQFNNLIGEQADRPARVSFRWLGAGQRDKSGFGRAVKNLLTRRRCPLFALKHSLKSFQDKLLAHPLDHRQIGLKRLCDIRIAPSHAFGARVSLEQDARGISIRGKLQLFDLREAEH